MSDLGDTSFTWVCPICGQEFKEDNLGSLEARRIVHERTCKSVEKEGGKTWQK